MRPARRPRSPWERGLRAARVLRRTVSGMGLPLAEARQFIEDNASPSSAPAVTEEQVQRALTQCRIADDEGRWLDDPAYVPTYWATRAAWLVVGYKLAKDAPKVDLEADGASIKASQRTPKLRALKASLAAQMLPGSP